MIMKLKNKTKQNMSSPIMLFWHKIILSVRQLGTSICRGKKLTLPIPFFGLKTQYKSSFYWRQCLISPETAHLTPLVSSQIFIFPQLATLGNLKLLLFLLSFLYRLTGLCWRCYVSWSSKPPLWIPLCFSHLRDVLLLFVFCSSICLFVKKPPLKNLDWWRSSFASPTKPSNFSLFSFPRFALQL